MDRWPNGLFVHIAPVPDIDYNYSAAGIINAIYHTPIAHAKAEKTEELAAQSLDIVMAVRI